jgi:hypothetical protein
MSMIQVSYISSQRGSPLRGCSGRFVLISLALVLGCAPLPDAAQFQPGLSRAQLLDRFGPPAHRKSFHKTGEGIWGPIENFWPSVPRGRTVEIWTYPVHGGSVELYFVDGSERVQGAEFSPEGAVYEGGRS